MKYEWRKQDKTIYLPKNKPEFIDVPSFNFLTIEGEGNPNGSDFQNYIQALYALSYTIKMTLKKGNSMKNYQDYTVFPLEGVWDINDKAKKHYTGTLNKDDLVFKLMIRQPNFMTLEYFEEMQQAAIEKKQLPLLSHVNFEVITEGPSVQMLHIGPYDDEPESFQKMETFAVEQGYQSVSKIHREIYLSDFRKVAPEKLKTVLRFGVK